MGLGVLIISPYLIRNVLITGWIIYPLGEIDLFDVPWKIPLEYLKVDSDQIKVWGRCLFDVNQIDLSVKEWLPVWWDYQERYGKMLVLGNLLGVIMILCNLQYKLRKKIEIRIELLVLYMSLIISLLVWFFMAPFIRYGLAFLLVLPLLGIAEWMGYRKKGLQSIVTGCLVMGIFVSLSPFMDRYVTETGMFVKQTWRDPYYITAKDYDDATTGHVIINDQVIYYHDSNPEEGEINSYHYYPNTCYQGMLERSTLAGNEIKDGFIPK